DAVRAEAPLIFAGQSERAVQRLVVLPEFPAGPADLAGRFGQARYDVVHAHAARAVRYVEGERAGLPVRMRFDVGDRLHRDGRQVIRLDDADVLGERPRLDRPGDFIVELARMRDARAVGGESRI